MVSSITLLTLLLLVVICSAQLAQVPFTSKCPGEYCLLVTHGGWSFYRVRINPALWPAGQGQKVTDDVIYNTCYQASKGQAPPCMGRSSLCRFYSSSLCQATSELGCEQPMLTTAIAMGCSSPQDPQCKDRLIGSDTSAIWASMGNNWGTYSCGRVGTLEHENIFCVSGNDQSVDGTWWGNCDNHNPPCDATTIMPRPAITRTLQHYAFCVGKTVCTCVHGECDMASDNGACLLGSCSQGWGGINCNIPCTSAFCSGRHDPTKANGGFYVNSLNQCVCECLPQWGPGGLEGCTQCTLPGSHECVAYTAEYLATTTMVTSVPAGSPIEIDIEARFQQNHQVDPNINTELFVELNPGGGNGDGKPVTFQPNPIRMLMGRATVRITFASGCDACVIVIKDLDTTNPSLTYRLQPLVLPPIEVFAAGTKMQAVSSVGNVTPNVPFMITLQIVDDAGSVDRSATNRVRVSLQGSDNQFLQATSSSNLQQTFNRGQATWELILLRSCIGCSLRFEDMSITRTLPQYVHGPIQAVGTAVGLRISSQIPSQVRKNQVFDLVVEAIDTNGDIDTTASGSLAAALRTDVGGGNGNGGSILNKAGTSSLTQPIINGRTTWSLSFTNACFSCVITVSDILPTTAAGYLGSIDLPPISVLTIATQLAIMTPVPTSVLVGQIFALQIAAVDGSRNIDESDTSRITISIAAASTNNNGNGGQLVDESIGGGSLTRIFLKGNVTWQLSFSRACDACIIMVEDIDSPVLAPLRLSPIAVTTTAVRLAVLEYGFRDFTVQRKVSFPLRIGAVDADGSVDRSNTGRVLMLLRPGGGNGDGGTLTNTLPSSNDQNLVEGEALFNPVFSESCTQCQLEFRHVTPTFPVLVLPPILVTTNAIRFKFIVAPPAVVSPGQQFTVTIQAIDDNANYDVSERGFIQMKNIVGGSNGNGGILLNEMSSANPVVQSTKGQVRFNPSFTQACADCRLQFQDVDTALPNLVSDPIVVSGDAARLSVLQPVWARQVSQQVAYSFPIEQSLVITVRVLDSDGFTSLTSTTSITAEKNPGGGNGDGGIMREVAGRGLAQTAVNGEVTFNLGFDKACDSCVLTFVATNGVASYTMPPFRITSPGVKIAVVSPFIATIGKSTLFPFVLEVQDAASNIDQTWNSAVRVFVREGGGNGNGGQLLYGTTPTPILPDKFVNGKIEYTLSFSQSCDACVIEAQDSTGRVQSVTLGPIKVTTTTYQLKAELRTQRVVPNVAFEVNIQALDIDNNINKEDTGDVSISLAENVGGVVCIHFMLFST